MAGLRALIFWKQKYKSYTAEGKGAPRQGATGCAQNRCKKYSFAPNKGDIGAVHNPTSLMAQCSARISSDGMFSAV
jgi:hypothetical protein